MPRSAQFLRTGLKDISILPIKSKHLDLLHTLEKIHNDPFDRLIICQAKSENLCIITRDSVIPSYEVNTIFYYSYCFFVSNVIYYKKLF